MKAFAIATAALALSASSVFAQDAMKGMYVTGEGENRMVMGGEMAAGAPVLMGESGAAPAECPEGSYYENAQNQVVACGEGGAMFDMMAPASGTMTADGQPLPEGAMMLEMREGMN